MDIIPKILLHHDPLCQAGHAGAVSEEPVSSYGVIDEGP